MLQSMRRPQANEAVSYYQGYIEQVVGDDILGVLARQLDRAPTFFSTISPERSLHRYQPGKWTFRESVSHLNDAERTFSFRAFWFARGFDSPLPSFEQDPAVIAARPDARPWEEHIEEFGVIRRSTLTLFESLSEEAWSRSGIASGNSFTVRALAFTIAGHTEHHLSLLRERYF